MARQIHMYLILCFGWLALCILISLILIVAFSIKNSFRAAEVKIDNITAYNNANFDTTTPEYTNVPKGTVFLIGFLKHIGY